MGHFTANLWHNVIMISTYNNIILITITLLWISFYFSPTKCFSSGKKCSLLTSQFYKMHLYRTTQNRTNKLWGRKEERRKKMLGTIGASNVNSQIWKSLDMFFQRTSLPPTPPSPQGGFVVRAPPNPSFNPLCFPVIAHMFFWKFWP